MFPVLDISNGCWVPILSIPDGWSGGTAAVVITSLASIASGLTGGTPPMGLHAMRAIRAALCATVEVRHNMIAACAPTSFVPLLNVMCVLS